jgi:hypothetical protein
VASARDIWTQISVDAQTNSSGLRNLPLIFPAIIPGTNLVHIPCNWSASSTFERADAIVEAGGVLSIKGHLVTHAFGYIAADGLTESYASYLHTLFSHLEVRYGTHLWWTTMATLSLWYRQHATKELQRDIAPYKELHERH